MLVFKAVIAVLFVRYTSPRKVETVELRIVGKRR